MAADDVSAAVQSLFSTYAHGYQTVSAQAAAFHSQFVSVLSGGAAQYLSTEIANVQQALPNAVNGAAAPAAAMGAPVAASFSFGRTFGPVALTLTNSLSATGAVSWSGSLSVPPALAYAFDAVGAPLGAATALRNSIAAIGNAVQTGNPLGFVKALVTTPGNVVHGLLYGQGTITESIAVPTGLPFTSAGINIPYGGLLAPLQPVSVTLTPPTGAPTVVPLGGTEFGGLIPAVQDGLLLPAVRGLLLPAVSGLQSGFEYGGLVGAL